MTGFPQPRDADCAEEQIGHGSGGPGAVLDHEELGRFLYRPDHLTIDGLVAPAALPTTDLLDATREGLSVGRLLHLSPPGIRRLAAVYEGRHSANTFLGFGVVLTASVRQLLTDHGRRELCVVDDPREGFPAHALVLLADRTVYTQGSVRRLRGRLIDLFTFRPAEESGDPRSTPPT